MRLLLCGLVLLGVQACAIGGYASFGVPCAMEPAENRCAKQWLILATELRNMDIAAIDALTAKTYKTIEQPELSKKALDAQILQLAMAKSAKYDFTEAERLLESLSPSDTEMGMFVDFLLADMELHRALGSMAAGLRHQKRKVETERAELQEKIERLGEIESRLNRRRQMRTQAPSANE